MANDAPIHVTIDPASVSDALHKRIAEIAIGEQIAKSIASACESYKIRESVESAIKSIVASEVTRFVSGNEAMKAKIQGLIAEKITDDVLQKIVNTVWEAAERRW